MAWTSPKTWASNDILTAADMNTYVRDNLSETCPATATAQGDLVYADAANSMGTRIAKGTQGQVLTMTGASTLGWGPYLGNADTAEVTTSESTTSTSYVDLATAGPAVTVTTGTSALVFVTANCKGASGTRTAFAGFAVSGDSTIAAADKRAVYSGDFDDERATTAVMLDGSLTAGSNTFTMKYRTDVTGTCTFENRVITVLPL